MTYVVGLTGGIGSGKSAVADAFAALGVDVTDTDRLAHALTAPGPAGPRGHRSRAFGPAFACADGTLDRARLRGRVFDDAARARGSKAILHPLIREAARREIAALDEPLRPARRAAAASSAAASSGVDRVLVVDCPEDEQVRRVTARSGLAAAEVRAIMATQLRGPSAARARRRRARQRRAAVGDRAAGRAARPSLPRAGRRRGAK